MKRRVLTILLFLLLGAVVNVAVAWGCALRSDARPTDYVPEDQATRIWNEYALDEWDPLLDANAPFLSAGLEEGSGGVIQSDFGITDRVMAKQAVIMPSGRVAHLFVHQLTCGFPFRSFRGATRCRQASGAVSTADVWVVDMPEFNPNYRRGLKSYLPVRPIWSGLALNTLIYAIAFLCLCPVRTMIARSIRYERMQCQGCGYRVGHSEICTECGASLDRAPPPAWIRWIVSSCRVSKMPELPDTTRCLSCSRTGMWALWTAISFVAPCMFHKGRISPGVHECHGPSK